MGFPHSLPMYYYLSPEATHAHWNGEHLMKTPHASDYWINHEQFGIYVSVCLRACIQPWSTETQGRHTARWQAGTDRHLDCEETGKNQWLCYGEAISSPHNVPTLRSDLSTKVRQTHIHRQTDRQTDRHTHTHTHTHTTQNSEPIIFPVS